MTLELFSSDSIPTTAATVVNVASVPQRSPFRYPGGKTWLIPRFRAWLQALSFRPAVLVEPFAGGGSISLCAAMENLVDEVVMVEKDPGVAAVWSTILGPRSEEFVERILGFRMSRDVVVEALALPPTTEYEIAFQTLLRNRVQRGGIIAPGASLVKNGENGRGVASRWYPQTLARRIREIARHANRINFLHGDGIAVLRKHQAHPRAVFFIDPPYTAGGKRAGKRLYHMSAINHEELFEVSARVQGAFMMTYDDASEVESLARQHRFHVDRVPMSNTHHATMQELIISGGTGWNGEGSGLPARASA